MAAIFCVSALTDDYIRLSEVSIPALRTACGCCLILAVRSSKVSHSTGLSDPVRNPLLDDMPNHAVSNYDAASVPTKNDRSVLTRINETLSMSNVLVVYWAIYWLMNGLDKFLNRKDLGIFTWHGKDRTEQFSGYFSNSAIPESWINSLLYLVGFWEILIFVCLAKSLSSLVRHSQFDTEWLKLGMNLGAITFVIFSFFDVIFGDRAELLEHGTFLILVVISYHLILNRKSPVTDNH